MQTHNRFFLRLPWGQYIPDPHGRKLLFRRFTIHFEIKKKRFLYTFKYLYFVQSSIVIKKSRRRTLIFLTISLCLQNKQHCNNLLCNELVKDQGDNCRMLPSPQYPFHEKNPHIRLSWPAYVTYSKSTSWRFIASAGKGIEVITDTEGLVY